MLARLIKIDGYSPFKTLMLREYWDNHRAIFTTPLIISIITLLLGLSVTVFWKMQPGDFSWYVDGTTITSLDQLLGLFANLETTERARYLADFLSKPLGILFAACCICMIFISMSTLYDERKDGSILFWKSMPVSDIKTVLSKIVTVLFVTPLVAILFGIIIQIFILLMMSSLTIGTEFSAWTLFWSPTNLGLLFLTQIMTVIFYSLWAAPVFAWFMLASMIAKRTPLLFAVIPPVVLVIIEGFLFKTRMLSEWIIERLTASLIMKGKDWDNFDGVEAVDLVHLLQGLGDPAMWIGLGIAGGMLYGTALLRKRIND